MTGLRYRRCVESVQFGIEPIDEGHVPLNAPEHVEAGAVMGEPGTVLALVQLRRWQQRQFADLGDLVRNEDRARTWISVRDAIAQLPFAEPVIDERRII